MGSDILLKDVTMEIPTVETAEVLCVQSKLILFVLEALQQQRIIAIFDQQDYLQILLKLSERVCEEMD